MTYPNPAGYYGLELPEIYENEITELSYFALLSVTFDLTACLDLESLFVSSSLSRGLDDFFNKFSVSEKLALLRWLSERLSALYLAESNAKT